MKIRPTGYRILVQLDRVEKTTSAGIIIATEVTQDAHQKAIQEAVVVDIGVTAFKAFDDGEPWCKVGDRVFIAKYSGEDRVDPDTDLVYRIVNDQDILAVLEEETNE